MATSPFISIKWCFRPYKPYIFRKLIIWWWQWPRQRPGNIQGWELNNRKENLHSLLCLADISFYLQALDHLCSTGQCRRGGLGREDAWEDDEEWMRWRNRVRWGEGRCNWWRRSRNGLEWVVSVMTSTRAGICSIIFLRERRQVSACSLYDLCLNNIVLTSPILSFIQLALFEVCCIIRLGD